MLAPLIVCLGVAWMALVLSAPFLPAVPAALTYAAASFICHQLPERSFHSGTVQLPVCARCLGIYAGFAIGGLVAVCRRRRMRPQRARIVVAAGAVPTLVTVAAEWIGLWPTSNGVRFVAGLPLGAAIAFVVIGVLATLHCDECVRRPPITPHRPPSLI
jgi:uncharacterized membrane protein